MVKIAPSLLSANFACLKDEIDEIFKSIDTNNTGKIDYTEFLAASACSAAAL